MVLKVFVTELDLLGLKKDHIFAIIHSRLYRKRGNGAILVPNGRGRGRGRHETHVGMGGSACMSGPGSASLPSCSGWGAARPPSAHPCSHLGTDPPTPGPELGPLSPSTWPSVLSTEMVGAFPTHRSVQMPTKQETNESSRKRERRETVLMGAVDDGREEREQGEKQIRLTYVRT